ncbi:MAG TPA: phosphatase PAP2 family protein [Candidatus Dormibacteraeota bacterium]
MAESDPQVAVEQVATGYVGGAARRWLALVAVACLVLFAIDAWLVLTRPLYAFDVPIEVFVQGRAWGPIEPLMRATNAIAGYWQLLLGAAVVLAFLPFERRGAWLMAIGGLGSVLDNLLKVSFERQRPDANLVRVIAQPPGFSFPSGHAVFYTWLFFMLAFSLAPRVRAGFRPLLWAAALFGVFVGCLGRVWVGAHWPSDVIGGFLLGLGWSAFVLWLPERWLPSPGQGWLSPRRYVRRRGPRASV